MTVFHATTNLIENSQTFFVKLVYVFDFTIFFLPGLVDFFLACIGIRARNLEMIQILL